MSDISQTERQIYIIQLLSTNHRGFTLDNIMDSLKRVGIDISPKTLKRDIDDISESFCIYDEKINNKTCYFIDKINIKNITFDFSELLSLYFSKELLKAYSSISVGKTAISLVDKIIASAPNISKSHIETLNDMMKVSLPDVIQEKELNSEILNAIQEAIADRKRLVIDYHSFNKDETTKREIDPYLLDVNEGCYHLIGFCYLRNELRDFRVSRIKGLIIKNESFIKPKNFYEDYKQKKFDKLTGNKKIQLTLKFKGYAARFVKEYEASKADEIQSFDDGSIIFKKETTMTPEIEKWVLGYGSEVEVIEPKELRDKVIKQIWEMLNIYKA